MIGWYVVRFIIKKEVKQNTNKLEELVHFWDACIKNVPYVSNVPSMPTFGRNLYQLGLPMHYMLRGAQRKAAPCPRIMGLSPQSGVVHTRDVFREGSRVLASEARARANERERVRGSQFTRTSNKFNYKT